VVVGELTLATLLVTSAMLLTRTVAELNSVELGFDAERLALVSVGAPSRQSLEAEGVSTTDARADRQRIVREEIAGLPGVESVAVTAVPIGSFANNSVVPEGWDESRYPPVAERRIVSPNFFEVAGIDIVEGRGLEPQDLADGPTAIVVSEGLADLGWPNRSPIGSQIEYRAGQTGVVVGVAGNVRDLDLREPTAIAFYAPGGDIGQMVIRVSGDPEALLPAIRERIQDVDPDVAILQATTFTDQINEEIAEERYRARLMTIFAVFATLLALMGIYGVTSRAVARRAKEMGVRLALGAKAVTVQRMVTIQAVRLGGLGVVAGLALSFAGWRVLERFIWGVSVADPLTLTAVTLAFPAFAAAAALGPARRATRVNPLQVLKSE
jgi:predicted permease